MPSFRPLLARLLSVAVGFPLALALGTAHAAYNVTIEVGASAGGSWSGNTWSANASGATVSVGDVEDRLASGDVSIDTGAAGSEAGDITVAATLAWDANRLTLSATGDILVQALVIAPSPAGLTLTTGAEGAVLTAYDPAAGFTGRIDLGADESGALVINGQTYHVVTDADGLFAAVRDGVSPIALGGDVVLYVRPQTEFLGTRCNLSLIDSNPELSFCWFDYAGVLNGLGHAVSNLVYRMPTRSYFIGTNVTRSFGLFETLDGATISNLELPDISLRVDPIDGAGLLAGKLANGAEVTNVHVSGSVENYMSAAGGLVGQSSASTITDCSAAVTASSGALRVGGWSAAATVAPVSSAARPPVPSPAPTRWAVWWAGAGPAASSTAARRGRCWAIFRSADWSETPAPAPACCAPAPRAR
jgi:hypothetical protein